MQFFNNSIQVCNNVLVIQNIMLLNWSFEFLTMNIMIEKSIIHQQSIENEQDLILICNAIQNGLFLNPLEC